MPMASSSPARAARASARRVRPWPARSSLSAMRDACSLWRCAAARAAVFSLCSRPAASSAFAHTQGEACRRGRDSLCARSFASARIQDLPLEAALNEAQLCETLLFGGPSRTNRRRIVRCYSQGMALLRAQETLIDAPFDEACAKVRAFAAVHTDPATAASRNASTSAWPLARVQKKPLNAASDEAWAIVRVFAAVQRSRPPSHP